MMNDKHTDIPLVLFYSEHGDSAKLTQRISYLRDHFSKIMKITYCFVNDINGGTKMDNFDKYFQNELPVNSVQDYMIKILFKQSKNTSNPLKSVKQFKQITIGEHPYIAIDWSCQ